MTHSKQPTRLNFRMPSNAWSRIARRYSRSTTFPPSTGRSIRTTNPIESTFGTIRHRTRQAKGCVSRQSALHMMFKLGCAAETHWRRLRGFKQLAEVVEGIKFIDGLKFAPKEENSPTINTESSVTNAAQTPFSVIPLCNDLPLSMKIE